MMSKDIQVSGDDEKDDEVPLAVLACKSWRMRKRPPIKMRKKFGQKNNSRVLTLFIPHL